MRLLLTIIAVLLSIHSYAQKNPISVKALSEWEEVGTAGITKNGKYSFYIVRKGNEGTLHLRSTDSTYTFTRIAVKNAFLTGDDRYIIIEMGIDSIGLLELGSTSVKIIGNGSQLQQIRFENSFSWLKKTENTTDLTIWNQPTGKFRTISQIAEFYWNSDGESLFYTVGTANNGYKLYCLEESLSKERLLWRGKSSPSRIVFDNLGTKAAFFIEQEGSAEKKKQILILSRQNNQTWTIDSAITSDKKISASGELLYFDKLGKRLLFSILEETDSLPPITDSDAVSVDIWHYKEDVLQSQQLNDLGKKRLLFALYDLNSKTTNVLSLDEDETCLLNFTSFNVNNNEVYLIKKWIQRASELQVFNHKGGESKCTIFIFDLKSGLKIPVVEERYVTGVEVSPNEKYIVYYDNQKATYFSYDVQTGATRHLSADIHVPLFDKKSEIEAKPFRNPVGIAGWLDNDQTVFIYDQYDIWQVDLKGIKPSICITGGNGRKFSWEIRFADFARFKDNANVYSIKNPIFLKIVDLHTLNEGWVKFRIGNKLDINKIITVPRRTEVLGLTKGNFIVNCYSNKEVPNWFATKDFESFRQLSFLEKPNEWNWYTKELVTYAAVDGQVLNGILYKPENFDPTKKYPIIFQLYELQSYRLLDFERPRLSTGAIDPAWFATRGYLVFLPDIYYKYGQPGESVYNSVIGAAKFLIKNAWVDSTHMGISGASQGGLASNYLVTRTSMFRAAASGCGVVDMISGYNGIRESGFSRQYIYESSQSRIGATLWDRPDLYINNSAIMKANMVTTPILIMHNKGDQSVPWAQGLEWFLALRRLGKPVWMLQYDEEGHGVYEEKNCLDYTFRLEQFFDHYLREKPMPVWMSKGVPAKLKKRDFGFRTSLSEGGK